MNYLASGIKHSFTFELLDPFLVETRGNLTVYSADIQEGYYTDSKATLTLECEASGWLDNSAVRIYDTATLDGETETTCIGTFVLDSLTETKTDNMHRLSLDMLHPIDKLTTDLVAGDYGVAAGLNVGDWCKSAIEGSGCNAVIRDGVSGTFNSSWVWEHGESKLEALNRACGSRYQVDTDTMGNVVIAPYIDPANREPYMTLTAKQITDAVEISTGDIVNRVVVEAEQDGTQLSASATVEPTHPWAWAKLGRWYTKSYTESNLEDFSQAAVDNLAAHYLAENDGTVREWDVDTLYFPVACGQTLRVEFGGESVVCMVSQRRYSLGDGTQSLILKEVY